MRKTVSAIRTASARAEDGARALQNGATGMEAAVTVIIQAGDTDPAIIIKAQKNGGKTFEKCGGLTSRNGSLCGYGAENLLRAFA